VSLYTTGMLVLVSQHFAPSFLWFPVAFGWCLTHYPHHDISFDGNWFLRIMVPPIVFEAALSIDKRSFNRHIVPILVYAVIGTLLATGLTAIVLHKGSAYFHGFCETIPLIDALAFGALISSIDPIAVLSVLSNMGMTDTDTIYVVIFGESLLNDGVAIVLFQTLVHFLDDKMEVDIHAITAAAIHFLVVAVGSLLVGVASGFGCTVYYWMMHGCQTPLVEVLMFVCWALIPYYICDGIGWSGIVAVVATGFVLDIMVVGQKDDELGQKDNGMDESEHLENLNLSRRPIFSRGGHLSSMAKTHIGFVAQILSTTMETAIFAYLGLFLFSSRYHWNFYHTTLAICGCCVSRAIMIPCLSFLANSITRMQQKNNCQNANLPQLCTGGGLGHPVGVVIDRKMQMVLWVAGLRGAMSFALVEHIPLYDAVTGEGSRLKSELVAMTSASIMFTVFILGGSTFYMMDGLGMAPSHATSEKKLAATEMELAGLLPKNHDDDGGEGEDSYNHDQQLLPFKKSPNTSRHRIQQRED
jgi:NhaP-type Na+/H+ or K+/H+ antiporter